MASGDSGADTSTGTDTGSTGAGTGTDTGSSGDGGDGGDDNEALLADDARTSEASVEAGALTITDIKASETNAQ